MQFEFRREKSEGNFQNAAHASWDDPRLPGARGVRISMDGEGRWPGNVYGKKPSNFFGPFLVHSGKHPFLAG